MHAVSSPISAASRSATADCSSMACAASACCPASAARRARLGRDLLLPARLAALQLPDAAFEALQLPRADRGFGLEPGKLRDVILGGQLVQLAPLRLDRRLALLHLAGEVRDRGLAAQPRGGPARPPRARAPLRRSSCQLTVCRARSAASCVFDSSPLSRAWLAFSSSRRARRLSSAGPRLGLRLAELGDLLLVPCNDSRRGLDLLRHLAQLPRPRQQAAVALLVLRAARHAARRPHDLAVQRDQRGPAPAVHQPAGRGQVFDDERVVERQLDRRRDLRVEAHEVARQPDDARALGHVGRPPRPQRVEGQEGRAARLVALEELDRGLRVLPAPHHHVLHAAAQRGLHRPLVLRRHVDQLAQRPEDAVEGHGRAAWFAAPRRDQPLSPTRPGLSAAHRRRPRALPP